LTKSIIFENVIKINCGIESYSCQTLLENKENKENKGKMIFLPFSTAIANILKNILEKMSNNEGLSSEDSEKTLYKTFSRCILRDMVTFS